MYLHHWILAETHKQQQYPLIQFVRFINVYTLPHVLNYRGRPFSLLISIFLSLYPAMGVAIYLSSF